MSKKLAADDKNLSVSEEVNKVDVESGSDMPGLKKEDSIAQTLTCLICQVCI